LPADYPAERDQVIAWLDKAARKAVDESRDHFPRRRIIITIFGEGWPRLRPVLSAATTPFLPRDFGFMPPLISEIDPQGAFPAEMSRHEPALHYQVFAIEPLVMIAELARRQGMDVYSLQEKNRRFTSPPFRRRRR
jgi:hypothetical protein